MAVTRSPYRINLTTTAGRMHPPAEVPEGMVAASVHIQMDPDTSYSWTSAVVDVRWSIDGNNPVAFDGAIQLTSSTPGKRHIDVRGISHLHLVTTTAEGSSDPAAHVFVKFSTA